MKHLLYILLIIPFVTLAQVGIGTTAPDPSSVLDITDTTKGLLIPRMTESLKDAIASPATGLIIYQTNASAGFYYFNGVSWQTLSGASWATAGNAGTNPASNSVGTVDTQDFVLGTNGSEVARVSSSGNVGIGTNNPSTTLHVLQTGSATVHLNDGFEDGNIAGFTTGGSGGNGWEAQQIDVNTGAWGAHNKQIGNDENSWMEYTATLGVEGTISFAISGETEGGWDFFNFYIDGVLQPSATRDGYILWETITLTAPAGTHTYRWEYIKDDSGRSLPDEIYIDDVLITEPGSSGFRLKDGNQQDGRILTSDATGVAVWKDPAEATGIDDDWTWDSGSGNDDPIYHVGPVFVGSGATTTTRNLQVWNGFTDGTVVRFGSVEFLTDFLGEIKMSHFFTPQTTNSQNMGLLTKKWTYVHAVNGVVNTSDVRLKEDIKPITLGLTEVLKLRPVSFKWKQELVDDFKIPNRKKEYNLGFIAQEVQKLIPDAIVDKEWYIDGEHPEKGLEQIKSDRLGISYSEMIPVVIKAIQEQQEEINDIAATNKKLKKLIAKLEK